MYCPVLLEYIRLIWPPTRDVGRCPQGSLAVPIDRTGTASVAPVKAPLVPGVQKPPRRVGKRFWDSLMAAPEGKVKKPAGLKMRPAWLRQDCLGANAGCQAWRPRPCKPWGSWRRWPHPGTRLGWWRSGVRVQDDVGAVAELLKGWDDAAPTDPDEGGGEEVAWQLVQQLGARIVPRHRNSQEHARFLKKFLY